MKVLLSKPGLDGHDVGVKVLAHGLIDAGFEVVYTGLRKTIEEIVDAAIKNKVDIIGMSILSGTHLVLAKKMNEVMQQKKLNIPWFVGGNIPAKDIEKLKQLGAHNAFPTGSKIADVVNYFNTIKVNV
ncbi:MAG: methylmalonyl-CoA mutase [Bacteroidetes bacterium]|nr:methylmalonyl-CoA mutase [Bacteroidota bacterium]MBV6461299.1 putative methylmalonyl-CoA mutase large subunit [Flavobacteriales bacterium]WKZ75301.1 MAG: cobalamin-dependent protein [Vicingaceae bacterium]MCL4816568.1 cobalamin-dependent protein [Flavobacteriales bacterium]NOG94336.1 methylmalonyl-CoA mutase [Bacteroidota bacterium]